MLKNHVAAAVRHVARNRLYSAISILGLAIGMCAALSAALAIRGELQYDQFFPGYERTYRVFTLQTFPQRGVIHNEATSSRLRQLLELRSNGVEAAARLATRDVWLRRGSMQAKESIAWADPTLFDVLPLPSVAGDLRNALRRPDGIVLTRSVARKYFGRADPIGQTLLLELPLAIPNPLTAMFGVPAEGTYPMTVTAVIEDLSGTQLSTGLFASGLAAHSALVQLDNAPVNAGNSPMFTLSTITFFRLKPGAAVNGVQQALPYLVQETVPPLPPGMKVSLELVRVDAVHAHPAINPGLRSRVMLTGVVGGLILLIACINFVNLLTARSVTRAKEVAIRKTAGASRGTLILQFIGESFVYVAIATVLGLALTEWSVPYLNAQMGFSAEAHWWARPALLAWIAAGSIVLGLIVGAYPAFILSSFRPMTELNGLRSQSRSTDFVRQALVTLQFAILIGLLIVVGVVWQQRRFATTEALRVLTDQMLVIRSVCSAPLVTGLRALPGIRGVACSGAHLTGEQEWMTEFVTPDAREHALHIGATEFQVLDLLGVRPLAGEWPRGVHQDSSGGASQRGTAPLVLNESAVRELGFRSARAAIGQILRNRSGPGRETTESRIVAVIPDFSLRGVETPIAATVYTPSATGTYDFVTVRLVGTHIPEALGSIDRIWHATQGPAPIDRFFLDDHIERIYRGVRRQAQAFGLFAMVAALLACLGLVGLSASITERRTREIGVRKAMGADTGAIVRLLLWQFSKPVLWANLIAWPVAGYAMHRWLTGFAYHTELQPWFFAAAGVIALLFALLTVSLRSVLVARAPAVSALRYE